MSLEVVAPTEADQSDSLEFNNHPAFEANPAVPDEPWSSAFLRHHWSAARAFEGDRSDSEAIEYAVDRLLAKTGTAVWFGNGSIGKTQLLLWMASAIAAHRDLVPTWLDKEIKCRGHILILSAEDTQDHLHARIRAVIEDVLGLTGQDALEAAQRLHVMPFLSMTEKEFDHPNAGLFSNEGGVWSPNKKMTEIRALIEAWNAKASTDDRIVGVIMDSATSMAGFEAMAADAVTNFFFYLNRLCETLRLFWVVIGHTPKVQKINPRDPDADSAARLKGPAIWTTAPRTTVEVRAALGPGKRGYRYESQDVIEAGLATRPEDVVIVRVAKSNFHDVDRAKRILVRKEGGIFEDVTHQLPQPDESGTSAPAALPPTRPSKLPHSDESLAIGTQAVWELILGTSADRSEQAVSSNQLSKCLDDWKERIPGLAKVVKAGTKRGGGPRVGAVNWHLERLFEAGRLTKDGSRFVVVAGSEPAEAGWESRQGQKERQ